MSKYVSRAGEKLEFALKEFGISPKGYTCGDFGSNKGGFVDCLLQQGAIKVYSVETGYGILDWNIRNSEKVIVMERTNAMHVEIPEKVDLVTIDASWTSQLKLLPNAFKNLEDGGKVISLLKPHYEYTHLNPKEYIGKNGLSAKQSEETKNIVIKKIESELKLKVEKVIESPISGGKAGNTEYIFTIINKWN